MLLWQNHSTLGSAEHLAMFFISLATIPVWFDAKALLAISDSILNTFLLDLAVYCTSTPFLCLLTEAIVSLEHRLRGMEVAPQPEHRLRGEKCERVKKYAPQPRGRCSLQHGAPVEEQTCFLVGNNFLAFPVSLLYIIRS